MCIYRVKEDVSPLITKNRAHAALKLKYGVYLFAPSRKKRVPTKSFWAPLEPFYTIENRAPKASRSTLGGVAFCWDYF